MNPLAVVLGSTGYIGGRLVPRLLDAGYDVRVLVRHANKLRDVPWADRVNVVIGDLEDVESLREAFTGADVIYYLVHSMGPSGQRSFEQTERLCAGNVARAAADAG